MGESKKLREEIQNFKKCAIEVYVEEENVKELSDEMLDFVLEEGSYMKDIPHNEEGVVTEIYYYRVK